MNPYTTGIYMVHYFQFALSLLTPDCCDGAGQLPEAQYVCCVMHGPASANSVEDRLSSRRDMCKER